MTYIAVLPTSCQEAFQLFDKHAFIFLLYPAFPIISSRRDKALFRVCSY